MCLATCAILLIGTVLLVFAGLQQRIGKADVALVLGSKVELDGSPSRRLAARLDRTLELFRAGYFPKIIVSGATGQEGHDEALTMKAYLVDKGVPEDRIIVDSAGATTFLSAKNAREIARSQQFSTIFVVSQYFHLPRSRLALERCGFSTVHAAYPRFFEWRDVYSSFREAVGYVSYLGRVF